MRIVRLTTSDPNSIFSNDFTDDIKIEPKTQVALKSLSLEVALSEIDITSRNDTVNFQLSTAQGGLSAELTHDVYDNISYPSLLNDMNIKMNEKLSTTGTNDNTNIGVEIVNEIETTGEYNCKIFQGALSENLAHQVRDKATNSVQRDTSAPVGQPLYKSTKGAGTAIDDCVLYFPKYISRGGGMVRTKVFNNADPIDNIVIGFTTTNPDTIDFTGGTLPTSSIKYAVHLITTAVDYTTIINGVTTPALISQTPNAGATTNPAYQNNDVLEVAISEGKIVGRVYENGVANAHVLFSEDYNGTSKLYPFISLRGSATNTSVRSLRTTLSPFQVLTADTFDEQTHEAQAGLGAANPPAQSRNKSNHSYELEGQSLATFLGLNNRRFPINAGETVFTRDFTVKADNNFTPNNISDAFIVEGITGIVPLKSYDGETEKRKNILGVIPKSDAGGSVVYDATFPIFVDLDNANPKSIRNIACRVLNNDLSPTRMNGLGTIVLLLKDASES